MTRLIVLAILLAPCLSARADPPPADQAAALKQIGDRLAAIERHLAAVDQRLSTLETTSSVEARLRAVEQRLDARTQPVAYNPEPFPSTPAAQSAGHVADVYERGMAEGRRQALEAAAAKSLQAAGPYQPTPSFPATPTYPPGGYYLTSPAGYTYSFTTTAPAQPRYRTGPLGLLRWRVGDDSGGGCQPGQ